MPNGEGALSPPPPLANFGMGEKTKFLQHLNMVKIHFNGDQAQIPPSLQFTQPTFGDKISPPPSARDSPAAARARARSPRLLRRRRLS